MPANSLQTMFAYPHHAALTLATGKKGEGVLLHTPQVVETHEADADNTMEIMAITGNDKDGTAVIIIQNLKMFCRWTSFCPSKLWFKTDGFRNFASECPKTYIQQQAVLSTVLIPLSLTTKIQNIGNYNAENLEDITNLEMRERYKNRLLVSGSPC